MFWFSTAPPTKPWLTLLSGIRLVWSWSLRRCRRSQRALFEGQILRSKPIFIFNPLQLIRLSKRWRMPPLGGPNLKLCWGISMKGILRFLRIGGLILLFLCPWQELRQLSLFRFISSKCCLLDMLLCCFVGANDPGRHRRKCCRGGSGGLIGLFEISTMMRLLRSYFSISQFTESSFRSCSGAR